MKRTILILCLAVVTGGCSMDILSSATKVQLEQNAAIHRTWAEQAKGGHVSAPDAAFMLECCARESENLHAAAQWKEPPWKTAPTTRPTTLPWTPAD